MRWLSSCLTGGIAMTEKRKDSKKRVLKEGEYQRANGTYEYRWRAANGRRSSVYAKTLEELREKEQDIFRDMWSLLFCGGFRPGLRQFFLNVLSASRRMSISPSTGNCLPASILMPGVSVTTISQKRNGCWTGQPCSMGAPRNCVRHWTMIFPRKKVLL